MAEKLTIDKIRVHTLKYLNKYHLNRSQLSYILDIDKSSIVRFLNGKLILNGITLINLINILYYDNKTKESI